MECKEGKNSAKLAIIL